MPYKSLRHFFVPIVSSSHCSKKSQIDHSKNFKIQGYGSVFDIIDHQQEIIQKGAFSHSLLRHKAKGTSPPMLYHHNPSCIIGQWLSFHEDDHGLWVDGETDCRVFSQISSVHGLSIGFDIVKSHILQGMRVIEKVILHEVSLVPHPANPLSFFIYA